MEGEERVQGPKKLRIEKLKSSVFLLLILSMIFIAISLYLIFTSQSLADQTNSAIGLIIGICVLAFALIFFVSPILTSNLITSKTLIVRYGLLFKMAIPLSEIEDAEQIRTSGVISSFSPIGTKYSMMDKRFTVLRSRQGAVKIKLKKEMTTGSIFKRDVKEIVIDCSYPDNLLRRIEGGS